MSFGRWRPMGAPSVFKKEALEFLWIIELLWQRNERKYGRCERKKLKKNFGKRFQDE